MLLQSDQFPVCLFLGRGGMILLWSPACCVICRSRNVYFCLCVLGSLCRSDDVFNASPVFLSESFLDFVLEVRRVLTCCFGTGSFSPWNVVSFPVLTFVSIFWKSRGADLFCQQLCEAHIFYALFQPGCEPVPKSVSRALLCLIWYWLPPLFHVFSECFRIFWFHFVPHRYLSWFLFAHVGAYSTFHQDSRMVWNAWGYLAIVYQLLVVC